MAHNYILQVTAGPDYDAKSHKVVAVNSADALHIESEHISVDLNVRIQNYRGLPPSSPSTSPYFDLPPHDYNKDAYSIAFKFVPKSTTNADDLVFGNDFDHPIRDRLPPGFGTAFKIVKWAVDPGLDGDVYAEKPYLYGPLASSINTLRVGGQDSSSSKQDTSGAQKDRGENGEGLVFEEGGQDGGEEVRKEKGVPGAVAARRKYFLTEAHRKAFDFEAGRTYWGDFYNPYLDFNDFALRLPGFTLPIMKYWDGQGLRYVLKNRKTDTVYLVVLFTLYLKDDVNEDGSIKEGVEGGKPHGKTIEGSGDEDEEVKGDKEHAKSSEKPLPETNEDDVD